MRERAHGCEIEILEQHHDGVIMHIGLRFCRTGLILLAEIIAIGKTNTSFEIKRGAVARGDLLLHTLHGSCKQLSDIGFYAVIIFIENINQFFGLVGRLTCGVVHFSMSFLVAST